jgi:hypothetical protein
MNNKIIWYTLGICFFISQIGIYYIKSNDDTIDFSQNTITCSYNQSVLLTLLDVRYILIYSSKLSYIINISFILPFVIGFLLYLVDITIGGL